MEKVIPIKDGISGFYEQVKELADPWEILTVADAFKERPPLKYIIDDLFLLPSLNIVYGSPGGFKSMVMLDALAHVVKGTPWLNREVMQAPALWIDIDNGKRRTHGRVEAVARQLDLSPDAPLYYVSMPNPSFNAGDQASIDALVKRITARNVKFVVIDNLSVIHPGVSENDDAMAPVMNKLRYLVDNNDCSINIIHHQRKSKDGKTENHGESVRGHSSIVASSDITLLVQRDGKNNIIEMCSNKTRDVDVYSFGAEFHYEWKPGTKELLTFHFTTTETKEDLATMELDEQIRKIVTDSPYISQNKLAIKLNELFNQPVNNSKRRILYLEGQKKLLFTNGPKRSKLYYIEK